MGSNENPRAILVSSVSSDITLLTRPMFPFSAPCRHRLETKASHESAERRHSRFLREREIKVTLSYLRTSDKKERERPNQMIETIVPARHDKSTGLRPTWSERRFQGIAVRASAAKCTDTYDRYSDVPLFFPPASITGVKETYDDARVISHLCLISAHDWELSDKLNVA
jgi:hypothetical protein